MYLTQGEHSSRRSAGALVSLGLFLMALLPRAVGLGVFATADEAKWVYRSAQFLGALLRGDWAGTVVNLTPGVTTTWLGSLGLGGYYILNRVSLDLPFTEWLASLPQFRVDQAVLIAVRWPMVLLTSVGVVAFYHMTRQLTTERVAWLFALLLAFDPHFVALSRVLGHDAPAGLFVGLSLLAFMHALRGQVQGRLEWGGVIGSGVLAGLAWLSKSPAFFLVPFVGLVVLVEAWRSGAPLRVWLLRLAVWAAVAWIVFVLVWPAGWQDPVGTSYTVLHNAFLSATDKVEAEAEGYWSVPDLGLFYYLVNGVFKLSPFATLGLIVWMWLAMTRRRKLWSFEWRLLAFAVLFTVFMTVGGKRSSRYILPAWPALYLLAAIGIAQVIETVDKRSGETPPGILVRRAIEVLCLALPALAFYPYYFTYFNPLVGGPLTAPRLVKIGWGEGLDQVGRWLDDQPDAPALRVGSYYASALAPFFRGKISEVTAGGLDYVVLYRKQAQGGDPSPTVLRYFEAEEPVRIVRLGNIEYAWVYAGPGMQSALTNEAAHDIGILPKPLAFRPNQPYLPIGQEVVVDVLWLVGDNVPKDPSRLALRPLDDLNRRPGERSDLMFSEALANLQRWTNGLVISQHQLKIPDHLSRGTYGLLVDGRPLGAVEARQFTLPPVDQRLDANFGGQLRLVGYSVDEPRAALKLVWQASPRAWADYTAFVHLVDAAGNRLAGADAQPPVPTSQWARGEVVEDERIVPIPDGLAAGEYRLVVGLYHSDTGERLPLLDAAGALVDDSLLLPVIIERQTLPLHD
jgi:hypothetical protein